MSSNHLRGAHARLSRSGAPVRRILPAMIALCLSAGAGATGSNEILFNAGAFDTSTQEALALSWQATRATGRQLHLVKFAGAISPNGYKALEDTGAQIIDYIPNHAYLVYGDSAAIARIQSLHSADAIAWEGVYPAHLKIASEAWTLESKGVRPDFYSIQLVLDPQANAETLALIAARTPGGEVRHYTFRHYVNVTANAETLALADIAARPDVISIQPDYTPVLLDERATQIMANQLSGGTPNVPNPGDYIAWLQARGFTQAQFDASQFTIDVSDQGLDNGTTLPNHFGLFVGGAPSDLVNPTNSRVVYNKTEGSAAPIDLTGCGSPGHGGWVSHVAAGNTSSVPRTYPHGDGSFYYGVGAAPFARLGNSVYFTNGGSFTSPNFPNSFSRAYSNLGTNTWGARVSNHSWGQGSGNGAYNTNSQAFDALVRDAQPAGSTFPADGNQPMVVVVAAGNSGPGVSTVGAPSTAKNVIAAGGSQNVRPGIGDAVNADAMYNSSGRGPTTDGRNKPDILAPATNVAGGVVMNDRLTTAPGNYNTCYTSSFLPTSPEQQRYYRTGNGTSFASPNVAGAAALVRQWFINNGGAFANTPPSPAMTKAYLMNAATYMATLTDNLPSNNQGMGRTNLERAFDNTPRALRDQLPADRFTGSGQVRIFRGSVQDTGRPFRITLAYSDAPGSTTGNAYVNNLDLSVTVNGQTYFGNVFSGANSATGGAADVRNNVESVFLPAGVSGNFAVTVAATNIAQPADPLVAGPNQDFALVAYNSGTLAACPQVAVSPGSVPTGVVGGTAYPTTTFTAAGGNYTFNAGGSLPPGLSLSSAGVLSGTPTQRGVFNFSVNASSPDGCVSGQPYTIEVIAPELVRGTTTVTSGNGIVEPNECNELNVVLNNIGTNGATAVGATLSTTTPGVTVDTATVSYPNLAATTGTGTNSTPFRFSTGPGVACGANVQFTQTLTYGGGLSPTTLNFTLPVGQLGTNYTFSSTPAGATIPPGGTLVAGSAADDAMVSIPVPAGFDFSIYGTPVAGGSTLRASTNGNLQFVGTGGASAFANAVLPSATFGVVPTVFGFWDDLDLRTTGGGIYTNVVGTAPNRRFIVEWRGKHFADAGATQTLNMALIFTEGSANYEVHYPQVAITGANAGGASATTGVQQAGTGTQFTQFSFNTASSISTGQVLTATLPAGICNPGPGTCGPVDGLFAHGFEPATQ